MAGAMRGHRQRLMGLAWHIEALSRQKKLPKLSDVLDEATVTRRPALADGLAIVSLFRQMQAKGARIRISQREN